MTIRISFAGEEREIELRSFRDIPPSYPNVPGISIEVLVLRKIDLYWDAASFCHINNMGWRAWGMKVKPDEIYYGWLEMPTVVSLASIGQ